MNDLEERLGRLRALEEHVRGCTRCPLSATRGQAVPGQGPVDASIILIGEGPGYHEDRTGRPFVGRAGQLLEQLLASIGLSREEVYIANVVKCRPPGNRDPLREEIQTCKPYLAHQLRIIDPDIIVTLGRFAMERWLPNQRITRVHGQAFRYYHRLIVPMFHPAAALRRPEWKTALFDDFKRLPEWLSQARALRAQPQEKPPN
ncbi:MAG: uracil-DNA glycosylase [Ardenticatenaceae bacterium]